jgi:hypothetical protein
MQEHLAKPHAVAAHVASQSGSSAATGAHAWSIPVHRLPFKLLPPGTWDVQHVVEHYRKLARSFSGAWNGHEIDSSRLDQLVSAIKPARCYVGEECWRGYVVFEFTYSTRVVLECAFKNNATYISPATGE